MKNMILNLFKTSKTVGPGLIHSSSSNTDVIHELAKELC